MKKTILSLLGSTLFGSILLTQTVAGDRPELLAGEIILTSEETPPDARGAWRRTELVQVESDPTLPLIRVESEFQRDASGRTLIVSSDSEAADRVIVGLDPQAPRNYLSHLLEQHFPGQFRSTWDRELRAHVVSIDEPTLHDVPDLISFLEGQPHVAYAEGDGLSVAEGGTYTNDPYAVEQDVSFSLMNLYPAWDITVGSAEVVVAVIDTGVDFNHVDLSGQFWENADEIPGNGYDDDGNGFIDDTRGWNFVDKDHYPVDEHGHGTNVTGVLGARPNNLQGIAGVAWKLRIMPVKWSKDLTGLNSRRVKAIYYAIDNGADIINCSNSSRHSKSLLAAIEAAQKKGILVVAAAGNDSKLNEGKSNKHEFPASYCAMNNVLAVAASENNGVLASYSNYGVDRVDLAAPVLWTMTTAPGNQYTMASGTSVAAPQVAGVAALIKALHPEWDAVLIKKAISKNVTPQSALMGKVKTGGVLNAGEAVIDALSVSEGKAHFSQTNYAFAETAGLVYLPVERTGGSAGELIINYHVKNYTASFGKDYLAYTHGQLHWKHGQGGKQYIPLQILNDSEKEYYEYLKIVLKSPVPSKVGANSVCSIAIKPSDSFTIKTK